ncbi:MAG: Gfo/Idh/MocA family oxidoreductase, partial [Verrucomicrobiota bacterium]
MKFAIVGCGLIGNKRAAALPAGPLAVACDTDHAPAEALASKHAGCRAGVDARDAISDAEVGAVFVCTPNHQLSVLPKEALERSKHVLIEKPGGIALEEVRELLWASPREPFNLVQAESIGCHIITMTNDLISKIPVLGKDLDEFALDTVKMFARDSEA